MGTIIIGSEIKLPLPEEIEIQNTYPNFPDRLERVGSYTGFTIEFLEMLTLDLAIPRPENTDLRIHSPVYERPYLLDMVDISTFDRFRGYSCRLPNWFNITEESEFYANLILNFHSAEVNMGGLFSVVDRQVLMLKIDNDDSPQSFKLKLHKMLFPLTESLDPLLSWKNVKGYLKNTNILLIMSGIENLTDEAFGNLVRGTSKLGNKYSARFWVQKGERKRS